MITIEPFSNSNAREISAAMECGVCGGDTHTDECGVMVINGVRFIVCPRCQRGFKDGFGPAIDLLELRAGLFEQKAGVLRSVKAIFANGPDVRIVERGPGENGK